MAKAAGNNGDGAGSIPIVAEPEPGPAQPPGRPPLFALTISEGRDGGVRAEEPSSGAQLGRYCVKLAQIVDYEMAQQFAAVFKQRITVAAAARGAGSADP